LNDFRVTNRIPLKRKFAPKSCTTQGLMIVFCAAKRLPQP
jgi:hypothetical protein